MKQRLLSLIVVIALLLPAVQAYATAEEEIAAVVNDSVITVTDIQQRTDLYLSGAPKPSPEERQKMEKDVLAKLIDEALQMQEAKKLGITVDEAEINNGFAYLAKQNNLTPDDFRKRLKDSGVSIDSLYAQIKAEIAWNQVIGRKVRPQVNVSESDIDMTIDQLAHGSGKKQYHVAEIVLNVPNAAEDSDVRSKAEDLVSKIKAGERFSTVARENSQAPGANNGGDLGWVQEGQLSGDLDHALQQLQPGQITEPILADNSYHILFLREMRRSADGPVEEGPQPDAQQGPIVTLQQIVIPVRKKDSLAIIKAKMERGIALKKEIKSCSDMDKRAKEFPGSGALGKGYQDKLPDPLHGIVEKLAVNELSAPIHAPGGWAMVMVCAREEQAAPAAAAAETPAPKFSLDKSDEKERENVADKLGSQRMNQMADHYLRDLRAAAFIDKRI